MCGAAERSPVCRSAVISSKHSVRAHRVPLPCTCVTAAPVLTVHLIRSGLIRGVTASRRNPMETDMSTLSRKYPTHRAFVVTERKGTDKGNWREIGAAWPHDDGKGFSIKLDAIPLTGEIVLREPTDKDKADSAK
jgi:hypothetical protein